MSYDPSIFNISPYYDDFDPNNKFLKILFKPGYAVQARELTQLQSILQDQISKIGDHLFRDGSRILGAPISVRNANFLGLNTGTGTPFVGFDTDDWNSLVGGTVYWGATASGTIAHVLPPETDDKAFIVFDYVKGYSSLVPSDGTAPYPNGVTVGITASSGAGYSPFVPAGATYNGLCKLVTVGNGIFYVDGAFVVNQEQSFTPYYVATNQRDLSGTVGGVTFAGLDKKVGFNVVKDTVTSTENITLLDPSFGSPNYNAPGADRFVINLELDQVDVTDTPNDFIELLRFEDGKVTKKVDKVVYGDISQTLSRRTYDESGSYVVSPFDISIRESSSPENLDVVIGPGKAYVMGVEVETKYPTILGISKARTGLTASAKFSFNVGNMVVGASLDRNSTGNIFGGLTAYSFLNTLNGGTSVIKFRNSAGGVVGEAKLHGFIPYGRTAWAGFVNNASTAGSYVTGPSYFNLYLYGVCAGSIISGSSSAVIYGWTGGSPGSVYGGVTYAVLTPGFNSNGIVGSTFGVIGGSASADLSLVYEIIPTQGIKDFDSVVFYGKAVTKSSPSWAVAGATATWGSGTGMTGATFQFGPADIDLPSIPGTNNFSLVWTDLLSSSPTTNQSVLSQYHLVSGNGRTAGLVVSLGYLDSGGIASANVSAQGQNIQINVKGFHPGFTLPVRVFAPYKYTITPSNLVNDNAVAGVCRTKTLTTYENQPSATYTLRNINGRLGFTLPNYDLYSVTKVWRQGNDITNDFEMDDGQREGYYDHGALIVKKSKEGTLIPGTGSIYYSSGASVTGVTFAYRYFVHGGLSFGPFLGKHSYLGMTYGEIPLFTNPRTGRTVSLANCIDFRHSGPTFDAIVSKPYGIFEGFDVSAQATGATWSNYLPRIDRVSLKINPSDFSTSFTIDSGSPDLAPDSPPETENSLTLATLTVPAYTHSATDVVVDKSDVRRYTMADINSIEKRMDTIESFTKLTVSESEMDSTSLKLAVDSYSSSGGQIGGSTNVYSVSNEPVKTSIFTDDFFGHAGSDVSDANHRCSVDYEYGEVRPMFLHNFSTITPTAGATTNTVVSSDGLITFSYSSVPMIDSDGYNKSVKVNPTGTVNWLGFIDISKQYEPRFDTGIRPVVYSNNLSENDNWIGSNANATRGFGTQWNDWEYLWSGTQIRKDQKDDIQKKILEAPRTNNLLAAIPNINSGNEKTAVSRGAESVEEKLGNFVSASRLVGRNRYKTLDNRIVDRTVVPYIPASSIGITAYGMRPNSGGLALYVDGILVKSGLSANANGTVGVTFAFTLGSNLSGEKSIRITDSVDVQNATQAADKIFYCTGTVNQRIDGVYSTRNPEYRRQTVTSEGIIKDPFNREVSYDSIEDTIENNRWIDPLCQTFFVDKKVYPDGVFAKSVTLYFSEKDTTLPVTVQLRPTINGYPSPSVSFPFSTVTLLPSEVNTGVVGTSTTPVGTTFDFKSPVYLEPGEYAIAVITNSKNYELRANDSGINLINTGRSNSPFVGTLYQPQNIGPAAQNLSSDIAFGLNICQFPSTTGTVNYNSSEMDVGGCQVIKINSSVIAPQECVYSFRIDYDGSNPLTVYNGQNTYPSNVYTASKNLQISLNKPSTKVYTSPAIDAGLFVGVGAEMLVTTSSNPNDFATSTSSYVTKAITLPEDLVSNGIFATSEVCSPYDSVVQAWVRWSDRGESDLFGKNWVKMTAVSGFGSPKFPYNSTPSFVNSGHASRSDYDFRKTEWMWFGSNTTPSIRAYQVLLMFTTQNSGANKTYSVLPAARNFRMCSFRSV